MVFDVLPLEIATGDDWIDRFVSSVEDSLLSMALSLLLVGDERRVGVALVEDCH